MTGAKKGHVVLGGRADVVHLGGIEDDKQEPLTRLTVFFFFLRRKSESWKR